MYKDKEAQRATWRRYYYRNKEKNVSTNNKAKSRNLDFINSLKNLPCIDCGGVFPPYVMDFDHIEDKTASISSLVHSGVSISRIQKELEKCELVCANCHRIRTYNRLKHVGVA